LPSGVLAVALPHFKTSARRPTSQLLSGVFASALLDLGPPVKRPESQLSSEVGTSKGVQRPIGAAVGIGDDGGVGFTGVVVVGATDTTGVTALEAPVAELPTEFVATTVNV